MSVLVAAADRKPFATDDFLGGSADEQAAAHGSFLVYAGSYTVGDGVVTHKPEMSSFPNWVGTGQVPYVTYDGDRLVLSTGPILTSGTRRRSELTWTRELEPS